MNQPHRLALVLVLTGTALALALPRAGGSSAAPPASGSGEVTVEGLGEWTATPDRLEVRARISVTAEVASDAFDEYAEQRARALAGLESAGIDGLEVRGLGPSLSYFTGQDPEQMMAGGAIFIGGGQQMEVEPRVRYREAFVLSVGGIDQLPAGQHAALVARVLDAAVDQGMELASDSSGGQAVFWAGAMPQPASTPAPLVSLVVSDQAALEAKAFEAAMGHARQRAGTLAGLAKRNLGVVEAIEVLEAPSPWTTASATNVARARLRVRFALVP